AGHVEPAGGANAAATPATPAAVDTAEKTIVIESDLYRVELSNRGAVAHSWLLKKFTDESTPPQTLDVVHRAAGEQTGGWPLEIELPNTAQENAANQGLYLVTTPDGAPVSANLAAPAEVDFHWSDGNLDVTKKLKFDRSYVVQTETTVAQAGMPLAHGIAWRGGFGDATALRAAQLTTVFAGQAGKINSQATKNLGDANQRSKPASVAGAYDALGVN